MFGSCTDTAITTRAECHPTPEVRASYSAQASLSGRRLKGGGTGGGAGSGSKGEMRTVWINPSFGSFDDFGSAMLILYAAHLNNLLAL